jgi:hypothetical protein
MSIYLKRDKNEEFYHAFILFKKNITMRYKFILSLTVYILFVSCKQINLLLKENFATNNTDKWHFTNKSNKYLTLIIQGDTTVVFFDTGGGDILTLYNPKFNIDKAKIINNGRKVVDVLHNSKKYISYVIDSVKSPLFTATNMNIYISYKEAESFYCDSVVSTYGILGTNFYSYKKTLFLNYDKGYLQFLESKPMYEGFYEADAKFDYWSSKIYIKLTINGATDFFIFDTGNSTELQVDSSFNQKMNLDKPIIIESLTSGANTSHSPTKKRIYPYKKIFLGNIDTSLGNTTTVGYSNAINTNILNLHLIQKYNWIIDYTNKKLYFKPLERKANSQKNSLIIPLQKVDLINGKLKINLVNKSKSIYNLGSEIEFVQGNKVTFQNVCEYRKLLNNNSNWDSLKVGIKN